MNYFKVGKHFSNTRNFDLSEDLYVTADGRVFDKDFNEKNQIATNRKYLSISAKGNDHRWHQILVHDLVFNGLTGHVLEKGDAVHHMNGIGLDNRISNLKLATRSENLKLYFNSSKSETRYYAENQKYKVPYFALKNDIEIWKFNRKYNLYVSTLGRVKGQSGRLLQIARNKKFRNNLIVSYFKKHRVSSVSVSRLLADTFCEINFENYKVLLKDVDAAVTLKNIYCVPCFSSKKVREKELVADN